MLEKVNTFITKHNLLSESSTIIVGVSGGPDSLALLHFMWKISQLKKIVIIAAHVDHMFRGKESEEDMVFVEAFCEKLGIKCESTQINVTEYQNKFQLSAQVAARECRYRFFEEIMTKHQAESLALGHHGDDQIETILMRLTRGSSTQGIAGIQVKRPFGIGSIIRPFLCVTKSDIAQYCLETGLQPRIDPSNEKDVYTRNRFRQHILPFLKNENHNVHLHFQHVSELLTEDESLLEELTAEKMNTVIKRQEDKTILIDIGLFQSMPIPLQRRGIQLILNYLYKDNHPNLSLVHIESILSLFQHDNPSGTLHFPNGLRITRSYHKSVFTFLEKKAEPYCYVIKESDGISLGNGYKLVSEEWGVYPKGLYGQDIFIIDPATVKLPLYVRSRKSGDKMMLKGMNGRKKVKDIFIDLKVPRENRDTWPVVIDSEGKIIWLPLLKKSPFEAEDLLKNNYLMLKYKKQ